MCKCLFIWFGPTVKLIKALFLIVLEIFESKEILDLIDPFKGLEVYHKY